MAITKAKKSEILDKVKDAVSNESVVFLNFHGLPVKQTSEMRNALRNAGISYFVAKKTLVKKAFDNSGVSGEMPELKGELAIIYANDPTAPAREVLSFQKSLNGAVSILGGVFEKRFLNKVEMEEIARIPGMQVLRGMFVNVINSPIQGLAVAMQAIADKKTA